MRRWTIAKVAILLIATAAALLPTPPSLVEQWYSRGWYPILQRLVTPVTNLVPFAIFDLLVAAAVIGIVASVWRAVARARRTKRRGPLFAGMVNICVAAATVYLVFLAVWGLNYRRVPVGERLVLSPGAPSREAALALGVESVRRANQLHGQAHASGWHEDAWGDGELEAALVATQRTLGDVRPARAGRLKQTLFGPYFRWAGVDGMIDPFALEALANPDLLPWERPFVAAHESAHLAGYAHEAEASFVGWLVCQRGDAQAQYSGWLFLYWELAATIAPRDRAQLQAALEPGPRADLVAIANRLRQGRVPVVQEASWKTYDRYLRANRVEEGIRSYGEVVTLILRTRFEDGWIPVRRSGP